MNAAPQVKGRPTLGGPEDRQIAPSIIPQIRRVVVVEALLAEAWDGRVELMVIEWPSTLRLPAAIVVDIAAASDTYQWESSTSRYAARDLLRHACASALGCRPTAVDPDDLTPEQLRDAWSALGQSVIQFEGTRPWAVERTAQAFEQALRDLADEHGIGG